MFFFLYNISIYLYGCAIQCMSIFNPKAKLWKEGRRNWEKKLKSHFNTPKKVIWMHVASLGEFEQGRPLMEKIKKDFPGHFLLVSFFSPSGYEIRKNYRGADYICYLPLDTPRNARKFVEIAQPKLTIFVKYEFWFNFMKALRKQQSKTIFIATTFRANQYFFQWYGKAALSQIAKVDRMHVQNEFSAKLLAKHNFENVTISGDTRFDRVAEIMESSDGIPEIEKWINQRVCIVAGSTWPEDERLLFNWFKKQDDKLCLIIAQHHIDAERIIQNSTNDKQLKVKLFSDPDFVYDVDANILVIDNIGLLAKLYRYADFTYIGGGFGEGIHNILEAAVYGKAVVFGPNNKKFNEAQALIKSGGAISIGNQSDLNKVFDLLLNNPDERKIKGQLCASFVQENRGATTKIMNDIHELLQD